MLSLDWCDVVKRRSPENPLDMSASLSINDNPDTIITHVTCTVSVCKSQRVAEYAHLLWNCARAMDVIMMSEVAADEALSSCVRIRLASSHMKRVSWRQNVSMLTSFCTTSMWHEIPGPVSEGHTTAVTFSLLSMEVIFRVMALFCVRF